jgi:hypothetical protein
MCPFEEGDRAPLVDTESQLRPHNEYDDEKPLKTSWKNDGCNVVCAVSIYHILGLFVTAFLLGAMVPFLCQRLSSQHLQMHQGIVTDMDKSESDDVSEILNYLNTSKVEDKTSPIIVNKAEEITPFPKIAWCEYYFGSTIPSEIHTYFSSNFNS